VASKAFKYYARMFGLPYLFLTLGRPLFDLFKQFADEEQMEIELADLQKRGKDTGSEFFVRQSTEVNPENLEEGADENLNIMELQLKCQKLLTQIARSNSHMPQQLVHILRYVTEKLKVENPDLINIALGNFVFLRFINPAFLNPETFGLAESFAGKINDKMRRTLVLMCKVLQNLANEQAFGAKEKFMEPLNGFIVTNKNTLDKFYKALLTTDNPPENVIIPKEVRLSALSAIHNHINLNKDKIIPALDQSDPQMAARLKKLLANLDEEYASTVEN